MDELMISPAHRDAAYGQILDRLSGLGDIEVAIGAKNYDRAEPRDREYSDDLRLLLDDLGIGDGSGEPVQLFSPPRSSLRERRWPRHRSSLGTVAVAS